MNKELGIMLKIKKLFIGILMLVIIFGCNRVTGNKHKEIHRIISLAPAATEIICALGKGKDLVGVTNDCNYPKEITKKTKIGTFGFPSLEKIILLNPDLAIATDFSKHPIITRLNKLGIKVLNLENNSIENLYSNILAIGKEINEYKKALSLVSKIKSEVNNIACYARKTNKPKVFIEIWGNPLFTVGGKTYISQLVDLAGGQNITGYIKENYPRISEEIVLKENPRIIILTYKGRENVLKRKKWQNVDAVKLKQVYDNINSDIMQRPGPRITRALKELYLVIEKSPRHVGVPHHYYKYKGAGK